MKQVHTLWPGSRSSQRPLTQGDGRGWLYRSSGNYHCSSGARSYGLCGVNTAVSLKRSAVQVSARQRRDVMSTLPSICAGFITAAHHDAQRCKTALPGLKIPRSEFDSPSPALPLLQARYDRYEIQCAALCGRHYRDSSTARRRFWFLRSFFRIVLAPNATFTLR